MLLASATAGGVAVSPEVRLRVTREVGSVWKLSADYAGGQNFAPQFETTDATYGSGSQFFGFHNTLLRLFNIVGANHAIRRKNESNSRSNGGY